MTARQKQYSKNREINLLVAMLRFASLISRPMRDGVADPSGFSNNELKILMALSGEGESAGHDLAELMGMHAMNVSRALASLRQMGHVEPVKNTKNRRASRIGSVPEAQPPAPPRSPILPKSRAICSAH
jgi:DNA-binding MarR family transcriptional regulator